MNQTLNYGSRLVLGTAQLGMEYGIANRAGRPDKTGAFRILETALESGIDTFDTARAYGGSEAILGDFFNSRSAKVRIITKISGLSGTQTDPALVLSHLRTSFEHSLSELRSESIYGLLLHGIRDFKNYPDECLSFFSEIKKKGMAESTGVSVYEPEDLEYLLQFNEVDSIQVPVNVFDLRIIDNGFLGRALTMGKRVFLRSLFLQGLFLLPLKDVKKSLPQAFPFCERLQKVCSDFGIPVCTAVFCLIRDIVKETRLVIGAETPEQVTENARLSGLPPLSDGLMTALRTGFRDVPKDVSNPSLWKKPV
jgi:aryl-alcohol dehydrogenase-like predicted oxidoreductase